MQTPQDSRATFLFQQSMNGIVRPENDRELHRKSFYHHDKSLMPCHASTPVRESLYRQKSDPLPGDQDTLQAAEPFRQSVQSLSVRSLRRPVFPVPVKLRSFQGAN